MGLFFCAMQLVRLFVRAAEEKQVDVSLELDPNLPAEVIADPTRLQQVQK